MGLPDATYEGGKLANDSRYGRPCGEAQLAKTLAVYDRSEPRSRTSSHRGGLRFRGDVSEAVLARDPSVPAAWCGIEPDADSGGGNQTRNAL